MARPYRDGRAVHPRQSPGCQLEKLKLEAEADGSHAKIRRIDLYDRSSPNVRSDQPLSLGDFELLAASTAAEPTIALRRALRPMPDGR